MSERVVGIGLPVTVAGLNVTFAGDDLDSEYYAILVADGATHYVYNITRNDTQLITAKSGTEAGGYTLAVAAAAGWVTGDYCVPCVTNDKLRYANMTLTAAASANDDRWLLTPQTAFVRTLQGVAAGIAVSVSVWGLPARRKLIVVANGTGQLSFQGDFSGLTQRTIQNFQLQGGGTGIGYNDTGAAETGEAPLLHRLFIVNMTSFGIIVNDGGAGKLTVTDCMIVACGVGIVSLDTPVTVQNCTLLGCGRGINNYDLACTYKNVCSMFCLTNDWYALTNATISYCADSRGELAVGSGNVRAITRAQAALWEDTDNHHYAAGGRILSTSVLAGAGDYQAGQPATDIDGADITTSCPIGCHKGTANAFGVSWPDADEVDPLAAAFQTFAAAVTPAMDVPEVANVRTTDTVRGTPGTSTVPAAGDLKSGVQCGAGGTEVTGTRTDADPDAVLDSEPTYGDPGAPFTPAFDLAADRLAFEAGRNTAIDPGVVRKGEAIRQFGEDDVGTYEDDPPGAPTWATVARTPGDGKVTLHVVAAAPTDVIYARFRRFLPNGEAPWSAESETFKRVGTGDIVVTGLTNEQGYEFEVYASAGGVMSEWSEPAYCTPTDGSAAMIARVMAAVAAQVNALGLTDSEAHAVAAAVEIPPEFDEVNTACVKVFPDVETGEPNRGQVNEIRYRVNVAFCERSKTTLQQGTEMLIRERLRDQFLGKRLMGLPEAFCEKETESGIVDVDALWERFQWVSVITFEFVALRARG